MKRLSSPDRAWQKFTPGFVGSVSQTSFDRVIRTCARTIRLSMQLHARFFRCTTSFAVITLSTGADQILPGMRATTVPWQDMIEC